VAAMRNGGVDARSSRWVGGFRQPFEGARGIRQGARSYPLKSKHFAVGAVFALACAMEQIQLSGSEPAAHELLGGFLAFGLTLNSTLEAMLNEHHTHRTERRGSGYTQATRHFAEYINYPCRLTEYDDARLFADKSPGGGPRLRERARELGVEIAWRSARARLEL
jgi:hypothetical protein